MQTLSELIAQVESNSNPYAVRYESGYNPSPVGISKMAQLAKCSRSTARILCSMSWGLFQIMGDNLVALGLDCSPLEYCSDPVKQASMFDRFVAQRGIAYSLDDIKNNQIRRENFALHYNGPGNIPAYSARLLQFAGTV